MRAKWSQLSTFKNEETHMHATVRQYDGIDASRTGELKTKVNETLLPRLNKVPGFKGYYLFDAENGVMSSISLFDNAAHSEEATQLAATWVRDEKLESVLPNPPRITFGEVIAQKNGVAVA
jgi:hypothetical protein